MLYRHCVILAIAALGVGRAAELPEMTTDRPDFTESADALPRGVVQFESGFIFEHSRAGRENAVEAPSALLRIGLGRNTEVRVGGEGWCWSHSGDARPVAGFSDHEFSVKTVLRGESARLPAVAVLSVLSVPVGSDRFTSGRFDPGFKLALAKGVGAGFDLSGNISLGWILDEGAHVQQRAYSLSVGHALAGGFSGYWEAYAAGPAVMFNSGVTHPLGRNVQVDFEAGRALYRSETTWFAGFGISFRGFRQW